MKSLSKADVERRDAIVSELHELKEELESSHSNLEMAISDHNSIVTSYNDKVQEARDFAEEIAGEIESYIDDKSEKWQEGDRGQAYVEWRDEWQNFAAQDMDTIDLPSCDPDDPDELGNLPEAPSE